jgi:diguanylate cyclase (GGDEF)-like protein
LAYVDLDGFQRINDVHGHVRGDAVLVATAVALRKHARKADLVARFYADRFALLFVDCPLDRAKTSIERAKASLAKTTKLDLALSWRLVAARRGESAEEVEEVLERAEAELEANRAARREQRTRTDPEIEIDIDLEADPDEPKPVGLYATAHLDRFLAMQQTLSVWGYPLLPVSTPEVAKVLAKLLEPRLVIADVMLPSKGGGEELLASITAPAKVLVAPRRWWTTRKAKVAFPVLELPLKTGEVDPVLSEALPQRTPRIAPLRDERQAQALAIVTAALVSGKAPPPGQLEILADRPELDLVKRHLGA